MPKIIALPVLRGAGEATVGVGSQTRNRPQLKFWASATLPKFILAQRALRDRLMSRGKNSLPTVSRQFLTRNYPRPNCRVIARQVRDKNCLAAIFAPRHQSVASGPLGGGYFGPEKKLAPTPQIPRFAADTLLAQKTLPFWKAHPSPFLGFSIKKKPIPLPHRRLGLPLPPPRAEKLKSIRNAHRV